MIQLSVMLPILYYSWCHFRSKVKVTRPYSAQFITGFVCRQEHRFFIHLVCFRFVVFETTSMNCMYSIANFTAGLTSMKLTQLHRTLPYGLQSTIVNGDNSKPAYTHEHTNDRCYKLQLHSFQFTYYALKMAIKNTFPFKTTS